MLLSDEALAKIITDYDLRISQLELSLRKAKDDAAAQLATAKSVCTIEVDLEKSKCKAERDGWKREQQLYAKALDDATDRSWYESPYINFFFGTLISGGVCAAASLSK